MWLFNYLFGSDGACGIITTLLWHDIWFSSLNILALSAPAASMYRRRGVFVHEGIIKMKIKREISHATGSELPRAFVICSHMLMSFDYDRWPNVFNWEGGMTLFSILGSRRRKWCMSAFSVTYCLRCLHYRLAKSGALFVKYVFLFRFMKCVFLSLDPSVWFFFF